jgi:predicted RNA-binding Zn-ribbon protein involved in translation (DUF1610 family)
MNCPECGAEFSSSAECFRCGHVFSPAPPASLYEGLDDDAPLASGLQGTLRRCAQCGSVMVLFRAENVYFKMIIPAGKRLYFQCVACGKVITVRSLWRILLAIPGCCLFLICAAVFTSFPNWYVGIVTALLAFYPLAVLFEIVTRLRYPSLATPDTAAADED